jgi:hypothetical protein
MNEHTGCKEISRTRGFQPDESEDQPYALNPFLTGLMSYTGKRSRSAAAPLYRLRLALSLLWLAYRPLSLPRLDSG